MKFGAPLWLVAALLTSLVIGWAWRRHDLRQQSALARFVAPQLVRQLTGSVSKTGRLLQRALFLAAILSVFAALARPLVGYHWETISRRGNQVVFVLDTSRSMLTPDVTPNRLIRAKLAVDDMARQLDGDAIGIVAFAGTAFLVCPLTLDYAAFHESLDAVDVHTIPRGGTNISNAILAGRAALRRRPGGDKIMVLMTDGEDLEGDSRSAAVDAAKQDGLKIYTVGIGTTPGDLIPLPLDLGGGYVKDEAGQLVRSHLDEGALQAIATGSGGSYVHLAGQGEDFDAFLRTAFGALTKHDLVYRQQKIYNERFQWPLAAALLALLGSLVVGTRRRQSRKAHMVSPATVVPALVLALILPIRSRSADDTQHPTKGAESPIAHYNAGTSAYRTGQFSVATQAFRDSIKIAPASDAKRLADQEDAYYNLGNSLYRSGQRVEKSSPDDAIKQWTAAVNAYETALQLRADDADSRYNRDLVKRKIDQLQHPKSQDQGGGQGQGQGGGQGQGQGGGQGRSQNQPPAQGQPPPPAPNSPPPPAAQGAPPQGTAAPQAHDTGNDPKASNAAPPAPRSDSQSSSSASQAEAARLPGQMSADEARELLDSAKGEEQHSFGIPSGPRPPDNSEKPFKNW